MDKLRNILHMGNDWLFDHKKLYIWHAFIKLLNSHLREVEEVDDTYFNILESAEKKFSLQNPKRVLIEEYIKILESEGRLHSDFRCLTCEKVIEEPLSFARSFFPAHKKCIYENRSFEKNKIAELFNNKTTVMLNDDECDELWNIVLKGI